MQEEKTGKENKQAALLLCELRRRRPLVHCITNYVTANDCANILLAIGASPIMADDPEETEEIAAARDACARKAAGVMDAELHYVTMPGAAQITGMKQFLCRKYNKKDVNIRLVNQPDLVGGFVLKAGDTEYDYSLKGQLVRLRQAVVR